MKTKEVEKIIIGGNREAKFKFLYIMWPNISINKRDKHLTSNKIINKENPPLDLSNPQKHANLVDYSRD